MSKVTFAIDLCKGCGLCIEACPVKILRIAPDVINKRGHHPAQCTEPEKCTGCASCYTMCPDCVITVERQARP